MYILKYNRYYHADLRKKQVTQVLCAVGPRVYIEVVRLLWQCNYCVSNFFSKELDKVMKFKNVTFWCQKCENRWGFMPEPFESLQRYLPTKMGTGFPLPVLKFIDFANGTSSSRIINQSMVTWPAHFDTEINNPYPPSLNSPCPPPQPYCNQYIGCYSGDLSCHQVSVFDTREVSSVQHLNTCNLYHKHGCP